VTSLRAEQQRKLGSIPNIDKRFLSSSERLKGIRFPPSLLGKGYLRFLLGWQNGQGMKLTEHLRLAPRMRGAIRSFMPKEEEEKKKDEIDRHIQVVNTITSF
jgi:hypothetical protein